LGTTSDEYVNDIAIDGVTGAVFMTGYTYGNLGSPNQGTVTADAFLTKWDPSGLQEWTQQFGTTETDLGSGVITDLSGSVYLTGWTDGNLFLPNDGGYDAFLIKFTPEPTSAALLLIAWLAISNRRGRVNSRSHRRRKCA
jgi:hypothetical protein